MGERCHNCDRETCRRDEPTPKPWPGTYEPGHSEFWENAGRLRTANVNECNANTVNWRKRALAAEADLAALRESNTALQAALAAARVAVEELPDYYHESSCSIECGHKDCDCPAEYGNEKRCAVRRALGLEVGE